MQEDISSLLEQQESPILEFKRQWYWDNSTPQSEMQDKWGELIKDIVSLANGYINHVGSYRYLVFGFSESEKQKYNINIEEIDALRNIAKFKRNLIQKLESYTNPSLLDINIEVVNVDSVSLLVFEIPSPTHVVELKKELKTKSRHLDIGNILVRKGQHSDEVRTASFDEVKSLKDEFTQFRDSNLYKKMTYSDIQTSMIDRSIEKTVQLFIDKNSCYSLSENYPVKEKNWKEGIVFEVYRLEDGFSGVKEFIYIHDYSNQSKTLADIKRRNLVKNIASSVILIDKPKIKDVEKRKKNISSLFNTDFVFFIDEFGYKHLYKDCILPYEKFNLPVYVNSLYDEKEEQDLPALERLKEWFASDSDPLFVVSGHGGIGKTTLAKQFLDYVSDISSSFGILFIDSKDIINELSRNFSVDNKVSDLFDFYKALMDANDIQGVRFDKNLLQLSIDNGSLIVVLDGIDEVIAKLGDKFDLEGFITSIFNEYSSGLHKTKILVNCRDHFWNEVGKKIQLPEITLKAFNESLASDFFEQKLKGDKKKITKAIVMANDLAIEDFKSNNASNCKTYIPYLLDMIGYLINSSNAEKHQANEINSRYLVTESHTDQLVARICLREIKKLESLTLDQQIQLFIRISSSKQNGISLYDIKNELKLIVSEFDDSLIDKIKGHPLIQCNNNLIYFRYDVFDTYFKTVLVYDFFNQKKLDQMTFELARVVSGYLKYDSSFTESVAEKIYLNDDLVIFCIDAFEHIININGINKEMFVSSVVSFLMTLLQKSSEVQSNTKSRTELLEKLFGNNKTLSGLCLVDIFGNTAFKPTFDFRGKELRCCHFNNYEYFWECHIDEYTVFHDSFFKGIDPRQGVSFDIPSTLFSKSCNVTQIQHLLTEKKEENKSNRESLACELEKVFKLFYQRGNFYPRKQEEVRKKLSAIRFLTILIDKGVIQNFKDPQKPTMKQYKINPTYKSVIDYFEQGSPSNEFQNLIDSLI